MKYPNEITINVTRDRLVELMDNPENMKHWQKGLVSYEFLEGEPGQVGSTMQLDFKMGKRDLSMIETITINEFPERFAATYQTKGVWNLVDNHFTDNRDGTSTWVSDCEFKFSGFMRVMSWIMPKSMFCKQSIQYMEDFKSFAESQT